MATSTHEKMGFEIQIGDIIISPSPLWAKMEIQFKKASLLKKDNLFLKMTDVEKIRKQKNGRHTEKVEILSLSFGQSYSTSGWKILFTFTTTVEPRYDEHLYKEVLGITNNLFYPSNSKIYEKGSRYSEHILPFPWPFIKSRFHCIAE